MIPLPFKQFESCKSAKVCYLCNKQSPYGEERSKYNCYFPKFIIINRKTFTIRDKTFDNKYEN